MFAAPKDWSDTVLSEGSNSVRSQDAIGGSLKRKGTTGQKRQIEPIRRNLYLSNLVGTKRSEDRYSWTSPRRLATVIASVRLSTFNFVKMLRKCPFTVVSLMKRFAPDLHEIERAQSH